MIFETFFTKNTPIDIEWIALERMMGARFQYSQL